jgi:type I restriction enzyme S subunit
VIRDADRLDAGFAYWLFLHPDFNQHLCRTASGSKILHTAPSRIEEYRLALPPIEDQRRVASVLGALDDKIQSNRRLTTLLSETSGTLFAYLDAPVTKTIPLGEVVDVIDCLHSRKPERRSDGKLLLQLDNVREDGLLDLGSQFLVSDADYANWTRRIELREGDCVITNVGRVGAVARVPNVRGALGRNMTGLRCRSDWPFPAVLIEALISPRTRRAIEELTDAGTVMNALNVRNIPRLPLPMLSRDLLEQAEASLSTTWRVRESLLREGQTLGRLRDALLPKLISGQIPVPDSDDPEEVIGPPAGPVAVGQS